MKQWRLAGLEVGVIPRVVGTVTQTSCLKGNWIAERTPCDIVELRLDAVGADAPGWLSKCQRIESVGLPVILTLRMQAEGGKWDKDEAGRADILAGALEALASIDIEWMSRLRGRLCEQAESLAKPIIVSYHDFDKTPERGRLEDIVAEICRCEYAIPKISTYVHGESDIAVLRSLIDSMARDRPICVIGMGSRGIPTRTEFPLQGSALTYGYLDESTAPGQLPARSLFDALRQGMPAYNQDAVTRKPLLECM